MKLTGSWQRDRNLAWLAAAGFGSLALYVLLALRYPLSPSLQIPRATWSRLVEPTWYSALLHLAIYLGLTLIYLGVLHLLTAPKPDPELADHELSTNVRAQYILIVVVWLACSAVLTGMSPAGESHDIFDYLFRGRMMAEYAGNPLVDTPKEFNKTPYYGYIAWYSLVDTYGPLWEMTSEGVATAVRAVTQSLGWWMENLPSCPKGAQSCRLLVAYLTGYRLLAVILTGISGWLVASIVRRRQPWLAPAALAAWLWCPLTLIAWALGGHNDILMLALFFLVIWLLQRQQPILALLALILAAHVKLTALIWLPGMVIWVILRWGWRQALKIGLLSAAIGLGLSWLLYAPFGSWSSLPRMLHERSLYLANSVWSVLSQLFYKQLGWEKDLVRRLTVDLPTVLLAAAAVLTPLWAFNLRPKRWRSPVMTPGGDERQLRIALVGVSLLSLLLGSYWFQHWYILWVLAPAVLLPASLFTRRVLPWLVFGALSANMLIDFALSSGQNLLLPPWADLVTIAIVWGPALVAGIATTINSQRINLQART